MIETISSIIIEDEVKSVLALQKLLERYCPQVKVISTASNVNEAIVAINKYKPDLVFLDIELADGDGFEVLNRVSFKQFEIIFITAYAQYAVKAFEFSAMHYILKPINYLELQEAVERYEKLNKTEDVFNKKFSVLKNNLNGKKTKLILPDINGLKIINIDEIIRCEADHNYTRCYLLDNRKLMISKSLNKFESILEELSFARVHSKHLVNLKYIKKYNKGAGGSVIMNNDSEINVSKSRKAEFLKKLNKFALSL